MLDHEALQLALRARMRDLSVCTVTTDIAATATGYTRAAGSWITDGFRVGMEILAAGFSTAGNNGQGVITALTASVMTVDPYTVASDYSVSARTMAIEAEGSRTISVGLPARQSYENAEIDGDPRCPWIEENYVPGPSELVSGPADGGMLDQSGLYVINWYGVLRRGMAGQRRCIDALLAQFAARTSLLSNDDAKVVVSGDPGPSSSQIEPDEGHAVCTVTIPWRAFTTNAVAA